MSSTKQSAISRLVPKINMDITGRFTLAIIAVMTITFMSSVVIIYSQQSAELDGLMEISDNTVQKLFESSKAEAKKSQLAKINTIAALLADIAPLAIAEFDLSSLLNYAKMVLEDEDVSYAAFIDSSGNVLATSGNKKQVDSGNFVDLNIEDEGVVLGKVSIGFNYSRMNRDIDSATVQYKKDNGLLHIAGDEALQRSTTSLLASMLVATLIVVAVLYWMFRNFVVQRLAVLEKGMKDIAEGEGDLRQRVPVKSKDAIDRVGEYFNLFLDKIHSAISSVDNASKQLAVSSKELSSITDETKSSIDSQQYETEQVATAINEMAATVGEVARNATDAASATNDADQQALDGRNIVAMSIDYIRILVGDIEEADKVITKLRADSDSIGSVLDVIQGIAEQTNLLALNAAIEAARAGEQGRGFAVVADEVRTLAQRTQESTTEIKTIIDTLQEGAEKAVRAMDKGRQQVQQSEDKTTQAGTSLESITEAVAKINTMNTQIASAAEEQNSVAEEINQNIIRISEHAEKTANGAQTTQMASTELAGLSEELNTLMRQFKI